jgi:hypothetical protein
MLFSMPRERADCKGQCAASVPPYDASRDGAGLIFPPSPATSSRKRRCSGACTHTYCQRTGQAPEGLCGWCLYSVCGRAAAAGGAGGDPILGKAQPKRMHTVMYTTPPPQHTASLKRPTTKLNNTRRGPQARKGWRQQRGTCRWFAT